MKPLPRSVRSAILIVLAFFGLQTFQTILLKRAFAQEEHLLAGRLSAGVGNVINQAHRVEDDLSIYRVLDALEQTPGILAAHILRPASPGVSTYPLNDGAGTWGGLEVIVSDYFSRMLVRRLWLFGMAASALVWSVLFMYLQRLEREATKHRAEIGELTALLAAEKQRMKSELEHSQLKLLRDAACLQKAVERIERPIVFLDAQQRVAALNQSARERFGAGPADLGKSWHELSILNTCGPGLERSMASPGQVVEWPVQDGGVKLQFETDHGGLAGTWVSVSTPSTRPYGCSVKYQ